MYDKVIDQIAPASNFSPSLNQLISFLNWNIQITSVAVVYYRIKWIQTKVLNLTFY